MTHAMHPYPRPLSVLGLALTGVLILLASDPVRAGVEPPLETPEPVILSKRAPVVDRGVAEVDRWVDARTVKNDRTLRCWQEGQLIVERRVRDGGDETPRSVELADPQDRPMRLYDLRNAICMIE